MYELSVEVPLRIQHRMEGAQGKEGILHEHDLIAVAHVAYGYEPQGDGPVPFTEIMELVNTEVEEYRSQVLNRLPSFQGTHVLFEDLARVIFQSLKETVSERGMRLMRVEIVVRRNNARISYAPD